MVLEFRVYRFSMKSKGSPSGFVTHGYHEQFGVQVLTCEQGLRLQVQSTCPRV